MRVPGLFIVGTDTGVGKTTVATGIVRNLRRSGVRCGVLKPVATGAARLPTGEWLCDDSERLIAAVERELDRAVVSPLVYEAPLAPCVAARQAGSILTQAEVLGAVGQALAWWESRCDLLVVEGTGGLYCPLGEDSTVADLAVALDLPLIVVARRGLGTLNHTLMTVELALWRGLRIAGIVLNTPEDRGAVGDLAESTNAAELARRLPGLPILAELGHGPHADVTVALADVDFAGLARRARHDAIAQARLSAGG